MPFLPLVRRHGGPIRCFFRISRSDSSSATGLLGGTWSLAVEEHFYLVWPLVVRFCKDTQITWIMLLVSALALAMETLHARWIGFSLIAAASVSFIYLALFSMKKWLQAILTARFLAYTGTISYGIYVPEKIPLDVAN